MTYAPPVSSASCTNTVVWPASARAKQHVGCPASECGQRPGFTVLLIDRRAGTGDVDTSWHGQAVKRRRGRGCPVHHSVGGTKRDLVDVVHTLKQVVCLKG